MSVVLDKCIFFSKFLFILLKANLKLKLSPGSIFSKNQSLYTASKYSNRNFCLRAQIATLLAVSEFLIGKFIFLG